MRKIIWIPLVLAAAAASTIIALPFAIEHLAERWLRDQGVPDPAIENVDFNPFTGLLRIESAAFSGAGGERGEIDRVEVDLSWGALFEGHIEMSRLAVSGSRFDVRRLDDGRYGIGGLVVPLAGTAAEEPIDVDDEPWGLGLNDASIEGIDIAYRDESFDSQLVMRRIALDRLATWEPDADTRVNADLELDGTPIGLQARTSPLASEPTVEVALKIEGFSLGSYPALIEAANLARLGGLLSLDLNSVLRYRGDGALVANIAGSAWIDDAEIGLPPASVDSTRVEWSGELNATLPAEPSSGPDLSGESALLVTGFALRQNDQPLRLAAFERLQVEGMVIDALDRVDIARVGIEALEMLRRADAETAVGRIGETAITAIEITGGSAVIIDRTSLTDVVLDIKRAADGRLELVSDVMEEFLPAPEAGAEASPAAPTESLAVAESSSAAPYFRLGTLEIGGDSRVRFQDDAVAPPLTSTLSIKRLRLTGIDTQATDQPLHIEFEIQQADGATLTGAGDVRPFGEQIGSDLEIALARLDLTQLSSYLPGYNIQRGRLELDSRARLEGDTLEVANSLVIDGLKLSGKAAGEQSLLGEGMAMPLDVALDLLRDGEGKIKLELPVSGSLSDPQFGTGDIIRTAMQNALQKAALSYVKNALQPLGTILMFAKVAGKAARPRFEPVAFAPAASELTPEAESYLDKIGQLMAERPGLSITLCGVSTLPDRDYLIEASKPAEVEPAPPAADTNDATPAPAIPEVVANEPEAPPPSFEAERLELARERGAAIQRYLVSVKGIDAERLFSCRPTLEDDTGPPRVEITL